MNEFDEIWYLLANPEVRRAVMRGEFPTGRDHYEIHGQAEGRQPTRPADRRPAAAGPQAGRVACLVMAYSAPRVLAAASRVYRAMGWDVLVHLDAKVPLSRYANDMAGGAGRCEFIAQRNEGFWGGMSQLDATFCLLNRALGGDYDRFVLITDDTFPVRTPDEIAAAIALPVDRLSFTALRPDHEFARRYEDFALYDHRATNPRGGGMRVIDEEFFRLFDEMKALRAVGKKKLAVHWGFAYWALTRATVDDILGVCLRDANLWQSFRFSRQPDELMIQSVAGNFLSDRPFEPCPVLMEFPPTGGPKLYADLDSLPEAIPPGQVFARKFPDTAWAFCDVLADRLIAGEGPGTLRRNGGRE